MQQHQFISLYACSIILLFASGCTQWRTQSHLAQADALVREINLRYQRELDILTRYSNKTDRQHALKDAILIQHEYYVQNDCWTAFAQQTKTYRCYPCIRFKNIVHNDIARLKKSFVRVSGYNTSLAQDILHQLQDLELIVTLIVTMDTYQEEEKSWQQHKQQEELNALLHKQNEYLKEQNNLLKQQQKDARQTDDAATTGNIILPAYAPHSNNINPPRG